MSVQVGSKTKQGSAPLQRSLSRSSPSSQRSYASCIYRPRSVTAKPNHLPIQKHSPEDTIPRLVHLPRPNKRNVTHNRRFHQIPSPIELLPIFLVPRDQYPRFHASGLVPDRDFSFFDGGVGSCGRVERRGACGLGAQTGDEGALWDELEGDLAV